MPSTKSARGWILACMALLGLGLAAPAFADARGELLDAWQRMLASRFASETHTSDQGKESDFELRWESPGRVMVVTPETQIVLVPEGVWTKRGDRWQKPVSDLRTMVRSMLPMSLAQLQKGLVEVVDEGEIERDGEHLRVIRYVQESSFMLYRMRSTSRVFLDAGNRIVRIEGSGEAMGQTSSQTQTIRYDDSIRVVAPEE